MEFQEYEEGDLDIWICGLTEEEALERIGHIYQAIKANLHLREDRPRPRRWREPESGAQVLERCGHLLSIVPMLACDMGA